MNINGFVIKRMYFVFVTQFCGFGLIPFGWFFCTREGGHWNGAIKMWKTRGKNDTINVIQINNVGIEMECTWLQK